LVDGYPFLVVERRRLVQALGRAERRVGASCDVGVAGCRGLVLAFGDFN